MDKKTVKAWCVVANMKDGSTALNAIEGAEFGSDFPGEFDNIYPVYDNKASAETIVEGSPVLSLKVVRCEITYQTS